MSHPPLKHATKTRNAGPKRLPPGTSGGIQKNQRLRPFHLQKPNTGEHNVAVPPKFSEGIGKPKTTLYYPNKNSWAYSKWWQNNSDESPRLRTLHNTQRVKEFTSSDYKTWKGKAKKRMREEIKLAPGGKEYIKAAKHFKSGVVDQKLADKIDEVKRKRKPTKPPTKPKPPNGYRRPRRKKT